MSSNKSTRWHSRANFRLILLHSAITPPHLESRSPKTSEQGIADDVLLIRLTSSMTSQNRCNLLRLTVVFWVSPAQMTTYDQKFGMKMIAKAWRIFWFVNSQKNVDFRLKNSRSCHDEFRASTLR